MEILWGGAHSYMVNCPGAGRFRPQGFPRVLVEAVPGNPYRPSGEAGLVILAVLRRDERRN